MNYVITGGAGNISKPLAEKLLANGHGVTVVTRNENNVASLVALGAKAAVGSLEDVAFLTTTFAGADAVYTMVPPKWDATDWIDYITTIGKNFASAIKAAGVKYVVNLSSVGAHLPQGCGPVSGLYYVEQALNELASVHVKHLRPGYFFSNFFSNLGMVKNGGIIGGNYGGGDNAFAMVHTNDIAIAAAEELTSLQFEGKSIRYIAGDEKTGSEIASTLGNAIGKPDLPWVTFTDEQNFAGAVAAGLSEEVAKRYTEMGATIRSGEMLAEYYQHRPALSAISLETFSQEFAAAYHAG